MKKVVYVLLACAWATAGAQVYQRIGPDGQVHFSDRPGPDAERVEAPPVQAVAGPSLSGQAATTEQQSSEKAAQEDDAGAGYTEFVILSPTEEEGVRANDGNVTVRLSLQPHLRPGHGIALRVDGEDGEQVKAGDSMAVELSNLSRGRHTVEARVLDDEGNEIIRAGPVSFHVLRVAAGGR